ncbi:hypothetical protein ABZX40_15075 [Streptomyces sp. NPDC004610]|uniref:hypothetical protein n=1 Tax=unclassified Streptomyces TaxID=2593676 RepID=UPI0033A1EF79
MDDATWSFTVDQDGLVIPEGPTGTDENVRLAFETLVIPFGTQAQIVEIFLREWRKIQQDTSGGFVLGTAAATARAVGGDLVEIGDLYRQFETCMLDRREFELALVSLVDFLKHRNRER